MSGRDTFTRWEIERLADLLRQKVRADRDTQKRIRGRMRSMGFYITDFDQAQDGFGPDDLWRLVESGRISIADAPVPRRLAEPQPGNVISNSGPDEGVERRNAAAAKYRPETIRLLLVAEAPPASRPGEAERYFYYEEVAQHDNLFRNVCLALLGQKPGRTNKRVFLSQLRDLGVFLIDLKPTPVDGTPLEALVGDLLLRCRQLEPQHIVLIKATVFYAAYSKLKSAGLPVCEHRIPFPGSGQQKNFEREFRSALADIGWPTL